MQKYKGGVRKQHHSERKSDGIEKEERKEEERKDQDTLLLTYSLPKEGNAWCLRHWFKEPSLLF
jgi:hypothetical protein